MKPQKINNQETYSDLIERFSFKETLSNNYMLPAEVSALIYEERLYFCYDDRNCFFLVEKPGDVFRIYYLLNDLSNPVNIESRNALVAEILFRGSSGEPFSEIDFLKSCGFRLNLRRDQFSASIPDEVDCTPVFAKTPEDARRAINLFNSTFDRYSGDFIDPCLANTLFENKSLLCVYNDIGTLQGALEISFSGRNAWVSHLVVDNQHRGLGVADRLMRMFVTYAKLHDCKRLMLWVQHQNEAALALYKKYSFNYVNKSTISLIKE